jgi:hypothetical protein
MTSDYHTGHWSITQRKWSSYSNTSRTYITHTSDTNNIIFDGIGQCANSISNFTPIPLTLHAINMRHLITPSSFLADEITTSYLFHSPPKDIIQTPSHNCHINSPSTPNLPHQDHFIKPSYVSTLYKYMHRPHFTNTCTDILMENTPRHVKKFWTQIVFLLTSTTWDYCLHIHDLLLE